MGRYDNENFTDKNKRTDHTRSEVGFNLTSLPKENGYGRVGLGSVMDGRGEKCYADPTAGKPINLDGMENFRGESRFTGDLGGQERVQGAADAGQSKDSIVRMGDKPGSERIGRAF